MASRKKSSSKRKKNEIDVLSHFLVPKMEIVPEKDVPKILKKYALDSLEGFPKFLSSDPSVRALGAKPGDLIKIYREDPTGKYVYYRYVVEG